jgi:hypothetical protein
LHSKRWTLAPLPGGTATHYRIEESVA